MKEKLRQFMQGRNGADALCSVSSIVVIILLLLSLFTHWSIFYVLGIALMIYMYFRMFSRNIAKRRAENQKFLNFRYRVVTAWDKKKKQFAQRKTHRFFKCPSCRQKVRVPKGRGRICITCPKCKIEFIKKS